ncbi:MAG TPA: hypothetical protein DDZ68_08000 [Parvularcula sp.]|nr:hypothetical protein [Parvularcula sp.]
MASPLDRARQMLEFPGVVKKTAAEAMGVKSSAVSRILRGERKISAVEFERLQSFFRTIRGDGVEEPPAPGPSPNLALSPIYPARALLNGDWIIDLAAEPIQRALPPAPIRGLAEVYGFFAPDAAAWPRFKKDEIVWISPTEDPLPGDDVFVPTERRKGRSVQGEICELARPRDNSLWCRRFLTGELTELKGVGGRVLKVAARQS